MKVLKSYKKLIILGIVAVGIAYSTHAFAAQVSLEWNPSTSPDTLGYHVSRATVSGGPYTRIASTAATTYTDATAQNNTTYYYVVQAYDNAGNISGNSNEVSATVPPAPPPPPGAPTCSATELLCNNVCVTPICRAGSDCNDNNANTVDTCNNANTCAASCSNAPTTPTSGGGGGSAPPPPPPSAPSPQPTGGGGGGGATPFLNVSLSANPPSGRVLLRGVDLIARVSGTFSSTINYTFYCNRADIGTAITPGYDLKVDNRPNRIWNATNACTYELPGTYTAKVIVESGNLVSEARTLVNVTGGAGAAPGAKITVVLVKNLKFGMSDPEVRKLQDFLQKLGHFPKTQELTNFFGRITLAAAIQYQRANAILPAVGFVGPLTRAKMAGGGTPPPSSIGARPLFLGVSGDDVRRLQEKLQALGFFPRTLSPTGFFGRVTEAAVKQFQCARLRICSGSRESNGYGVVGPQTTRELTK